MSRVPNPQFISCTGLVLALEGGGTKTTAHLYSPEQQEPLAIGRSGSCNPSTNCEIALESVTEVWQQISAQHQVNAADVSLVLGAAGVVPQYVRSRFVAGLTNFAEVVPLSDGYAALVGAGGGQACGMVVAGTGCAGHRMRPDGTSIQRDGWGWVCGDRGSGAWLAMRSLEYALEVRDGLQPTDELAEAHLADLGGDTAAVAAWLTSCSPRELAAQAQHVFKCADAGMERAETLLVAAARELRRLFESLDCADDEPLFIAGSIAEALRDRIAKELPSMPEVATGSAITGCRLVATGKAPLEWPLGT